MVPLRVALSQRSRNIMAKPGAGRTRPSGRPRTDVHRQVSACRRARPRSAMGLGRATTCRPPTAGHVRRMVLGACATLPLRE